MCCVIIRREGGRTSHIGAGVASLAQTPIEAEDQPVAISLA